MGLPCANRSRSRRYDEDLQRGRPPLRASSMFDPKSAPVGSETRRKHSTWENPYFFIAEAVT